MRGRSLTRSYRRRRWRVVIAVLLLVGSGTAIGAAPPEPTAVVAVLHVQDQALLRVGDRLATRGVALCRPGGWASGMTLQLSAQYGAAFRAAAASMLGIGDLPTVAAIAPGSAAERAGLQLGDQLTAIDGQPFLPQPPQGNAGTFAPVALVADTVDAALANGEAAIAGRRRGQPFTAVLKAQPACHARFDVRAGRSDNASSDGLTLQVASELIADTRGDDELAAVLAHELAHSILRHPQRLRARERGLSVRATEIEADRLSAWLLDAAGYGTAGAAAFWGRVGRARDRGIFAGRSHPGWERRLGIIRTEAAAIASRRAAGGPVLPPAELAPR